MKSKLDIWENWENNAPSFGVLSGAFFIGFSTHPFFLDLGFFIHSFFLGLGIFMIANGFLGAIENATKKITGVKK